MAEDEADTDHDVYPVHRVSMSPSKLTLVYEILILYTAVNAEEQSDPGLRHSQCYE